MMKGEGASIISAARHSIFSGMNESRLVGVVKGAHGPNVIIDIQSFIVFAAWRKETSSNVSSSEHF